MGQAYAAHNIGWTYGRLGHHRAGLPYCQEALDIFTEAGDIEATAITWDTFGDLRFGARDPERGEHCYQQAAILYRKLGDRIREADVHTRLGDQRRRAGDRDAAQQAWQQALVILDDLEPDAAARIRARLHAEPV